MINHRPRTLVFVVGTGTGIGKTWLSSQMLDHWRSHGVKVSARKPAQSFEAGDETTGSTDAQILASRSDEEPFAVCPQHRWYPTAMAPPMAACALGRDTFTIADLIGELVWPIAELGLVETAGGVRSPQADDGDCVAMLDLLEPEVVILVGDAALGAINAVTLCLEALDKVPIATRPVVFLNRFDGHDELHRANRSWLVERVGVDIFVDPADVALEVLRLRSGMG